MTDTRKFNATIIVRGDTGVSDRYVLEQINRLLSITPRAIEDAIKGAGADKAEDTIDPVVELVVLAHRLELVPEQQTKQFGKVDPYEAGLPIHGVRAAPKKTRAKARKR